MVDFGETQDYTQLFCSRLVADLNDITAVLSNLQEDS
jgi:hypothetical protein